jgi:3',5'-cyclic AMP phosphodiesterase CpdA
MFRIAHISDLHIPPLPRISLRQLASKRLIGQFSWFHKWKSEHRQTVLDALQAHLKEIAADHICVTGDITFTTLPAEVDKAADWFAQLGDATRVSLIPGNHDAYVPGALEYAQEKWSRWMQDDDDHAGFPYLHRRGPVDIIGLSSAVPTPPGISLGRIGQEQLQKTEALLSKISVDQRASLLMVHHAPQDGAAKPRRALSDRKELQQILAGLPVDLVLHGHLHYPTRAALDGPSGPIPVLGAASASAIGGRKSAAHYHVIEMETETGQTLITVQHYRYDKAAGKFLLTGSEKL